MNEQYIFAACTIIIIVFFVYINVKKKSVKYVETNTNRMNENYINYELNEKLTELINNTLRNGLSGKVKGIAFILHSYFNNKWELDILGTYNKKYLPTDADWATDDFMPLQKTYKWQDKITEGQLLENIAIIIQDYLSNGQYSNELKSLEVVGLSSEDSSINFLYINENNL